MRPSILAALALGAAAPPAVTATLDAQAPPPALPWSADDILLQEAATGLRVSPDGRTLVWVRTRLDPDKGRVATLALSPVGGGREVALTRGKVRDTSPRWSPDGRHVAFLSTRPVPDAKGDVGQPQVWLIEPTGGEPWPLTSGERGVKAFEWKDSATVLVAASEDAARGERRRQAGKDDSRVVDDSLHEAPVRLFAVDVASRKVTRLTANADWIEQLAVSPDGRHAVTVHRRQLSFEFDQRQFPALCLWDLSTGEGREIGRGLRLTPSLAGFDADGRGFSFLTDSTRHPRWVTASVQVLRHVDLADGQVRGVPLGWPRGLTGAAQPVDGGLLVMLADGARPKLARLTREGADWQRTLLDGEHQGNIGGFAASPDGRTLAYVRSAASSPPELFAAALDGPRLGPSVRLARLNPALAGRPVPRSEVIRFRGARGEEVEAVLRYPLGYEAGRRYPLVLTIHGGPTGTDLDAWQQSWSYPHVLLNQRGAFTLAANYHGSAGYGLDWVESICCGRFYDLEVPDLLAGVDHLVKRGLVDPARLGTMGWSNGAILSTELTVRDPRFKAASVGAGDVEWISDWGNVDFGMAFDNYYFGAAPYQDPQLYIRKSPFFRLDRVRTPTLIFFGTEDRNVPPSQGWSHYRALQQHGKAEVRFVLFPGEPHGIGQLAHQRRKLTEEMAWFDRQLFDYQPAATALRAELAREAFDSASPLGVALRLRDVARADGLYGVRSGAALVPETVPVPRADSAGVLPFELGRFEVTRAQWAAYDTTYRVEPGTGNHPVTGVTFERARDYASWLVATTGGRWRLGTEAELRALYDEAGGVGETTLDWWAGYAPNPDDATRLLERVAWLTGEAPLVRAAGSGAPSLGRVLVFDLGGNAAEWAVGPDGGGVLLGGSADRPADPKARRGAAGEAYRGVRVVRDR